MLLPTPVRSSSLLHEVCVHCMTRALEVLSDEFLTNTLVIDVRLRSASKAVSGAVNSGQGTYRLKKDDQTKWY